MLKNKLLSAMGGSEPSDPYFSNTVLLLHGDGTNGAQNNTFIDSSANNFTITRNGNVTQGTFSPFPLNGAAYSPALHGGSGYFDGSGDWLFLQKSSAFTFLGDLTIEFWFYFPVARNDNNIIDFRFGGSDNVTGLRISTWSGTNIGVGWGSIDGQIVSANNTLPISTWVHIAVTRSGSSWKLFINGKLEGSKLDSTVLPTSPPLYIGTFNSSGAGQLLGYISNLRIVKGTALYTSNFTPPTAPVTAVTNTSLLLNFTNAGIYDNTGMNNLETVGNVQVSTTQKKFGTGAMYFDGSGDYLQSLVSDSLKFGTGDFTVEFWFNSTSLTGVQRLFCTDTGNWDVSSLFIGYGYPTSGRLTLTVGSGVYGFGGSTTLSTGTWYHVAVTRSGATVRLFLNGVQEISGTSSADLNYGRAFVGGFYSVSNSEYFNGYIDDFRITKGVARYTANFTPPAQAFPNK